MATAQQILDIARGEIGYSRWNDPEQGTKYGRWYASLVGDSYYGANGVPYCAMFVSWVFAQAGHTAPGLPGAYCPWMVNDTKQAGAAVSVENAQPGDIVYFDWNYDGESDHVGIVEDNEGGYLQTIEGNTDNGQVKRRTREYGTVTCVCRPTWSHTEYVAPASTVSYDLAKGIDIYNGEGYEGMRGDETDAAFVICKASEGIGFKDVFAKQFAEAVLGAGKLLGFYHFARRNDAEAEAEYFVSCVKDTGHLAEATLWLDYESTALENGPDWCKRFIDAVNRMTGKRCGIYTSQSVTVEQDFSNIASYVPLWVAQYATMDPTTWEAIPWTNKRYGAWGSECAIHQYSGNGYVPGWGGALDLNRGWFTIDQWNYWANINGEQPGGDDEPVTPTPYVNVIDVDGWVGPATVAEWQRQLGTYVDGVVSGQYVGNKDYLYRLVSATWEATGSPMVRAIQEKIGIDADGILGPNTVYALQQYLGEDADGYLGPMTAMAIQNSINAGLWL